RTGPDTVTAQLYHHADLPAPPDGFADTIANAYPGRFTRLELRGPRPLDVDLCPAVMLVDLLGLSGVAARDRRDVAAELAASPARAGGGGNHPRYRNVTWDAERRWRVPDVNLTIVGHFLRADIARMFGSRFVAGLRDGGPTPHRSGSRDSGRCSGTSRGMPA